MRIISDFRDYYDSVQIYGQDKNRLYHRKTQKFTVSYDTLKIPLFKYIDRCHESVIVGFAGNIYPYCYISPYPYVEGPQKSQQFTIYDTWKSICEEMEVLKKKNGRQFYAFSFIDKKFDNEDSFNSIKSNKTLLEFFTKYDAPIFSAKLDVYNKNWILKTNPCLSRLGFVKIKDPHSAFQELDQFIGTTLVKEQQGVIPTGDDVVLAKSKGFDKYSFRKDKSEKK